MKKTQNFLFRIGFWLSTFALLLMIIGAPAHAAQDDIIYEYETITQKKGEPFDKALKKAGLTAYQSKLVNGIPILHEARSDRQLRFIYRVSGKQRQLQEVKIIRGNRIANYVLTGEEGKHKFVSHAGQIPDSQLRRRVRLQSTNTSAANSSAANASATKQNHTTAQATTVKLVSSTTEATTKTTSSKLNALRVTQDKGQSLASAWQPLKLSKLQNKLLMSGDFLKSAKSLRTFTVYFDGKGSSKLLKGMRVSRNNQHVDYVVKTVGGALRLVNVSTLKSSEQKQQKTRFAQASVSTLANATTNATTQTVKTSDKSTKTVTETLDALRVTQNKGQSLASAWQPLKLSKLQNKLLMSGDFLKSAKSLRTFTVYFDGKGSSKLLKGMRVSRNKKHVDYVVKTVGGALRLVNVSTLKSSEKKQQKAQFAQAKVSTLQSKKVTLASTAKSGKQTANDKLGKISKPTVAQRSSGQYVALSFTQKKGQSLYSAMRRVSLTQAQRKLIGEIPANLSAKSQRKINLLFEKSGSSKYLRALSIVRGNQRAEFVLVKNGGKWTWANSKGEIKQTTTGKSGFTRYPVRFSRVSSPFNLRRRHPITRRIRPHKGIDLKAPHGTPIYAPANGVVTFAGRQRGYGIILAIDHQNGYKTRYAHLSRIMRGARKGKHVKKGQVIAKVGNTGISTGSHLHYEIIVNGRHRNPATVRLPKGSGGSRTKTLSTARASARKYLPILKRMVR